MNKKHTSIEFNLTMSSKKLEAWWSQLTVKKKGKIEEKLATKLSTGISVQVVGDFSR